MHINVTLGDISLRLLPARAAYWPEQHTLFVADTHFGKEATFRRHGIPVPRGSSEGTLAILSKLISETEAKHLVILGDMFHARSSLSCDVCETLSSFFAGHPQLRRTLVRGNHDAHVGQLPAEWSVEIVEPGVRLGTLALGHHPAEVPPNAAGLLCGHLHPALALGGRSEALAKLPCFWLSQGCLVLPAIGQFTGTHPIRLRAGDRAWVIADDQLIEHAAAGNARR